MSGIKGGHTNDYSPSDIEVNKKAEKKELISGRYLPPKRRKDAKTQRRKDRIELQSLLAKLHHKAY
ncbi:MULTISPECIES: hypothetical protein [unclassified Alteromonas]|uniref:hypothetical protein n=1 Tax=unclassified Alteromonas TaxID=2614992 RepID=UPI000AAD2B5B|nr:MULTISPECIES: hypothetical protein [unclassified Alteromonas]